MTSPLHAGRSYHHRRLWNWAQVLRLLSQAYLLQKQAAPALQCVQHLRKLDHAHASHPGVNLIAVQAHVMVSTITPRIACKSVGIQLVGSMHAFAPCC